jgi:hypothetical protein
VLNLVIAKRMRGLVSMEADESLDMSVKRGRIQSLSTCDRRCIGIRLVEREDPRGANERRGCVGVAS